MHSRRGHFTKVWRFHETNGSSLRFTAFARSKAVATYDLSEAIPSENITVGALNYVLFDDGTFARYAGAASNNEIALAPDGRYTLTNPTTVRFSGRFPWNDVYSTGTINRNAMRVVYRDSIDYDDEFYMRRN
ncbi:MAG: hypothetical protein ABIZ36_08420 [Gemmatimonadaceae bacterium]